MSLPRSVVWELHEALGADTIDPAGSVEVRSLGGGSIHHAARLETRAGPVFIKWSPGLAGVGFGSEARSLEALRCACEDSEALVVPGVLGYRDSSGELASVGWLALEYLAPGGDLGDRGFGTRLGRGLAALHAPLPGLFGWEEDNFIGPLPQANPTGASWPSFWRDARLAPQLETARSTDLLSQADDAVMDRVLDRTVEMLESVADEAPVLLHGDLWSGNVLRTDANRAALIDPSCYRGHREVDLAMAELFGGFPDSLHQAYHEFRPLTEGYPEVRRPLYQLYYLLVHLNLFGAGYLSGCLAAARTALSHGA